MSRSDEVAATPRYYFSTRDLLTMAALAGLGGVASTAINMLGAAMLALVGFAGTTQWAAGLHVTFLLLVAALTGKGGAATVAGLLKGGVELLSGNTHGVIILLVDVVAGLLIDVALCFFRRKDGRAALMVAGALSAASNVFVFQLFASAPEEVLSVVWAFALLAAVSGAVLGGLLAHSLLAMLRRVGLAPQEAPQVRSPRFYPAYLALAAVLALAGGLYLGRMLAGPPTVQVTGAVDAPYAYRLGQPDLPQVAVEATLHGMRRRAEGVPLVVLLAHAQPREGAEAVLVTGADGYAFFITLREVAENESLVLAPRGDPPAYDIVGARNAKAWVRNVAEIRLVSRVLVEARGAFERPYPFDPDDWQEEMDSADLDLGLGPAKYQGLPLSRLLAEWQPSAEAVTLRLEETDGVAHTLPLEEARRNDALRLWLVSDEAALRVTLAYTDGRIVAERLAAIVAE